LKQEIMWWLITSPTVPETPPDISHENTPTNNIPTNTIPTSTPSPTPETFHLSDGEYTKYVEKILNVSTKHEWTPYLLWWISTKGFDCSGLWYYAFKEAWIQFPFRFTASVFDKHNKDVSKNSVIPGDFMYWRAKPWQKKHSDIYHIEMVVEKPYLERWKWYVKTFGSSTDKGVYVNGKKVNKSGVGYRVREITDHRHFDRPSYYEQLVQYEKTWDSKILMAA
jgi:cell wall-associated NlpC family hydrolase